MEKDSKKNIVDNQFRDLLSQTRLSASENLKFRIMQQIETEKSLSKQKSSKNSLGFLSTLSILGVMYALIAVVGIAIYFTEGVNALLTSSFYVPIILIASVCSVYLLISTYDDKRHYKHKK